MNPRAALALILARTLDVFATAYRMPPDLAAFRDAALAMDTFAAPKRTPAQAVNDYQAQLQRDFETWADDLAGDLADEPDDDDRTALIAAALAALLALLKKRGQQTLPEALKLAFSGKPPTQPALSMLAAQIAENDGYLADNLIPALREKLAEVLADDDVQAAIAAGQGKAAIAGAMAAMGARVAGYASELWDTYNRAQGEAAVDSGKKIRWVRDPQSKHCPECAEFGDKTYDSYEALLEATGGVTPASGTTCHDNCHCELQMLDEDSPDQTETED